MYGTDIIGVMITDVKHIIFMKMDTQISTIEAYGHSLTPLSSPRVRFGPLNIFKFIFE